MIWNKEKSPGDDAFFGMIRTLFFENKEKTHTLIPFPDMIRNGLTAMLGLLKSSTISTSTSVGYVNREVATKLTYLLL